MRKSKAVIFTLALLAVDLAATGQSSDALMADFFGTWKLNVAKSSYSPGPPPLSAMFRHEPGETGFFRHTQDIVDSQGRVVHNETVARFDGKDYERRGTQPPTTAAYKRIDDRTVDKMSSRLAVMLRQTHGCSHATARR